jgi:hypothetical protein
MQNLMLIPNMWLLLKNIWGDSCRKFKKIVHGGTVTVSHP